MVSDGVGVRGAHPHTAVWTCSHEMRLSWWEGNANLFDWTPVSIVLGGNTRTAPANSQNKAPANKVCIYLRVSSPGLPVALVPGYTSPFIHPSIPPFISSCMHSFVSSFIYSSVHSFIHRFIHSSVCSFIHASVHSLHIQYLPRVGDMQTKNPGDHLEELTFGVGMGREKPTKSSGSWRDAQGAPAAQWTDGPPAPLGMGRLAG